MAIKSLIQQLHIAHLEDLKRVNDILPTVGDNFICPICLLDFDFENADKENLSVGHVWPAFMRKKSGSELAKTHRVLLCKKCNSDAGKHGDAHSQFLERVREGAKKGEYYRDRLIQILRGPGEDPIKLQAHITVRDQLTTTLKFDVDKKSGHWAGNHPKEQARFQALRNQAGSISMIVHPPRQLKPHLALAGWVTSAYLYAFYTFGYRYIFHEGLNVARYYITKSFEDEAKEHLNLPESDIFRVEMSADYFHDPQIGLVIPVSGDKPVYLKVNFLDYQIRLPFYFNATLLKGLIMSAPNAEELISQSLASGNPLYAPILSSKLKPHDWDYVLGKSLPTAE